MIEPHGGSLIDRVVSGDREEQLRSELVDGAILSLTTSQYQDLINISTGRYSPITGFLTRNDFLKVVHDRALEDGTIWPLPITLDVDETVASRLTPGEKVGLRGTNGELVGVIDIAEIFKYNKRETAEQIYGTDDQEHPGVAVHYERDDFLVGGPVFLFSDRRYNEHDLLPAESRVLFAHEGWDRVVGFQTRNAPHRAHEYIQKSALEQTDGLLIQPKLGEKKSGDYRDQVIIESYRALIEHYYPNDRVALSVFPSKMRYAGPREAVFDALIRKNQGCTHFVVGRDHAGVEDYFGRFASQEIFREIGDIGIEPLFYKFSFYCERCDGMASEHICPHDDSDRVYPSGSEIRSMIAAGELPSEKQMRPEVARVITERDEAFVTSGESNE